MSTGIQEADMEDLVHVADCARIPRNIMTYLIEQELVGISADIRPISTDDVMAIHGIHAETYAKDAEKLRVWSRMTTGRSNT